MKLRLLLTAVGLASVLLPATAPAAGAHPSGPTLVGRAVLPVETYAPGPPSGAALVQPPNTTQLINGISFPLPSQPVEGFSAVLPGRRLGEYLAMPDNGFGGKNTSKDFLIRAYYVTPDLKTAKGGSGNIAVGEFISFRDPNRLIGFPIVNEAFSDRLLTGGDIDPESLQRGKNGDFWMGDEFGPWILHFDRQGVLLDPPFPVPGDLKSPNNPFRTGSETHPNSRGIEAMAITPSGHYLYASLEGATVADGTADPKRRLIFEFDTKHERFTGRSWQLHTEAAPNMLADMWALDSHRVVVIERDGGLGVNALFRSVYLVDLNDIAGDGFLNKALAVDLTSIADPDGVSLPAIHAGDVGIGNPFRVVCESIEAVQVISGDRLLLGCDNNFPNKGRNPDLADDNELIIVQVPHLRALHA